LELQEGKNEKLKNISNKGKGRDPVTFGSLTLSGIFKLNFPAAPRQGNHNFKNRHESERTVGC
jgi:hypothetical protein